MLKQLEIENFALIEKLSLSLHEGLNILTGETGAGKSIILDALDCALGGKVSSRMIRTGCDRALVQATFTLTPTLTEWLNKEKITIESDDLVCTREITNRSSRSKVNGILVNKQQIQSLREYLIEITAQGQTVLIGRSNLQREWLDNFGGEKLLQVREKVRQLYSNWDKTNRILQERRQREETRLQQIDMFQYQLQELDAAELEDPEEMEKLEQERKKLSFAVDLQQQSYEVYQILYQNDHNPACIDLLGQAESILSTMTTIDGGLLPILEMIQGALVQVEEAGRQINSYGSLLETDPDRLSDIEKRLRQLKQICRKYGPTLPEAIANVERLRKQLSYLTEEEQPIEVLIEQLKQEEEQLLKAAKELTTLRQQSSKVLEKQMIKGLESLAMAKVQFQVQITPIPPTIDGCDSVQFLFSPNPGEPLQPLTEIASGGEMSRFLLALKTCFAASAPLITLVFDEIDVGVSGRVAQSIAHQLYLLSRNHQVLCVTHQPIVAAIADHHFHVSKEVSQPTETNTERTNIKVHYLDTETRKQELAQIAGGVDIEQPSKPKRGRSKQKATDSAIAFAESLLEQASLLKQK
ncbi:MAG: DNA repair protein RecN [Cyanobacteria bacterium KgW148]|nr:DNA repair protein RecN [Cyanobacteria bacterium KgW148]